MIKVTASSLLIFMLVLMGTTGCQTPASSTSSPNQEPVEVVSISTVSPILPGGPTVKITLKNVGEEPVIDVSATLELKRDFFFGFMTVWPSQPLLPGKTVSDTLNLIGSEAGIDSGTLYSLKIKVTLQDGTTLVYTKQVKIGG